MAVEIVAQIGSSHNGDLPTAYRLIHAAAACGADTVKFQHYPDESFGPHPMPLGWLTLLEMECAHADVGFLCSVFDMRTLTEYRSATKARRVKIASPELTNHTLLREASEAFDRVIVSTGMSTPQQIDDALNILVFGAETVALHCTSSYPAPPDELNLHAMTRLPAPYGLSDHSLDSFVAPVAATALGAVMVEKHFTLDRRHDGPDHGYALNQPAFQQMVRSVRLCELMLGEGVKRVTPSEDPTAHRIVGARQGHQ